MPEPYYDDDSTDADADAGTEAISTAREREHLLNLLARYRMLGEEIDARTAERKQVAADLLALLLGLGETEVVLPGEGALAVTTRNTRVLSAQALIARGVTPDIIDACTETRTSEPFLTWRREKGK